MDTAHSPLLGSLHQFLDASVVALHVLLNVVQYLVAVLHHVKLAAYLLSLGFRLVHAANLAVVEALISRQLVCRRGALLAYLRERFPDLRGAVGVLLQLRFGILHVAQERLFLFLGFRCGTLRLNRPHVSLAAFAVYLGEFLLQRGILLVALGVLLRHCAELFLEVGPLLLKLLHLGGLFLYFAAELLYCVVEAAAALLGVRYLLSEFRAALVIVAEVVLAHLYRGALLRYLRVYSLAAAAETFKLRLYALFLFGALFNAVLELLRVLFEVLALRAVEQQVVVQLLYCGAALLIVSRSYGYLKLLLLVEKLRG